VAKQLAKIITGQDSIVFDMDFRKGRSKTQRADGKGR